MNFCDQCKDRFGKRESAWFYVENQNLDFCSESCYKKYYNYDGKIINVNDIQAGSKVQLTIKEIKKAKYFSNRKDTVWIVTVDNGERIKYSNDSIIDEIDFFDNVYSLGKQKDNNWLSNTNSLYFFLHFLGKAVEIRIGNKNSYERVNGNTSLVFGLSDGRNVLQDKPLVLNIVNEEKKKWDDLGYDGIDANADNKLFVDAGIPKYFAKSIVDSDPSGWEKKKNQKIQEIIFKWKYLEAFRKEVEKGEPLFSVKLEKLPNDEEIVNFRPWKREIKAGETEREVFWTYALNWIDSPHKYPLRCYYHPAQLYLILKNGWDLTTVVPRGTYIGKIEYPENSGKYIDPLEVKREKVLEKKTQNLNVNNEETKVKTGTGKPERTKKIQSAGEVRIILLMGRTGNGKSTLGNVLINENGNFTEVFKESSSSVSVTKTISVKELKTEMGVTYRIIDTIGLGDTSLKPQEVLYLLAKIASDEGVKEHGINQVLFVTGGRFTKEEIDTFNLLRSVIFDSGVDKFTTIVRTGFEEFEEEEFCEDDRRLLRTDKNKDLVNFVKRVRKILYVDNPPINVKGSSEKVKKKNESNKLTREESRTRLLTYLGTCQEAYRSDGLVDIERRVKDYMPEEEKLQKQIGELEEKAKREREEQKAQLEQKLAEIQDENSQELARIRQEHANDQERLAKQEEKNRKQIEFERERWEREQDRLDKINELEAQRIREDMENKKQMIALEVERSNRERANIVSKAWHWVVGW